MDSSICPQSASTYRPGEDPPGTSFAARNGRIIREADTMRQILLLQRSSDIYERFLDRPFRRDVASLLQGGRGMPFYLTRFSYMPETWARLIKKPENPRAAAQQYIESVCGKLHGFWYAFGDHDAYNLWEAPDNVSMAAVAVAISAGGALSSLQTTALLTVEETLAALEKAKSVKYKPPRS